MKAAGIKTKTSAATASTVRATASARRRGNHNGIGSRSPAPPTSKASASIRPVHPRIVMPPAVNALLNKLAPGRTLGEVARGTDLNIEYISRIFNHKRTPSLRTAARIADFLNVGMDDLRQSLNI